MRVDLPELQRCCCCLPLRRGLIFWVYIKLVLELPIIAFFINVLKHFIAVGSFPFTCVLFSAHIIALVIDVGFCILFLVSAHRKKHAYMRIYYRYVTGMLILGVIAMVVFIGMELYVVIAATPIERKQQNYYEHLVGLTCFLLLQLVLHVYLVALVRSEVLKLERAAKIEFTNNANETKCKAQITV